MNATIVSANKEVHHETKNHSQPESEKQLSEVPNMIASIQAISSCRLWRGAAALILSALGLTHLAFGGAISLTTSGSPYTQNFNLMPSTAGNSPNTPINAEMSSPAFGFPGSGWWANGPVTYLKVDDGNGGTINNIVIYGANGNPDRALGYGGGPGPGSFGAAFSNNIANPITQLLISYTGEQWWNGPIRGSGLDQLAFEYSINATNLTSGTWTAVPALNFYSLNINTANYGPIDGNDPANKTNLTAMIPGLNIPGGKIFFVRWRAIDSTFDDGLAVDDFSLTPIAASGGPLHHYQVAANSPQNQGLPFTVTVTARDASNVMVSTAPPTLLTLTGSGGVLFDGNGNGTFGEPGDNQATILNGYCTIGAKADTVQTVTITATDANTITGTSSNIVINAYVVKYNRIGILWTSWDPYHYQDYGTYINTMSNWGINYCSLNPTYFINTYAEGITNMWNGTLKTPDAQLQKSVLKELITRGFYINYRPHIDPIKYAMPLGSTRDNWNTDPGGKDWRGKFNLLNPTDPAIGYAERLVLPSLDILANAIREAGAPVRPVRFDIGAELMDSMLNYPTNWQNLLATVRNALTNQHSDVASNIVLSHNFGHHLEYLLRLPGHSNYIARILPSETIDPENQYLDRPGVSPATKVAIGKYIAGLDEVSISQYMPLDIFNAGGDATNTVPAQVKQALQKFEDDFINEVLLGELQIPATKLPVLHIGEYGMGIRGLIAPNVWDAAKWTAAGKGGLVLADEVQKQHAAIAMQGIIQYVNSSQTRCRSFLLWMGGKPYDILDINYYSDWYNPAAANAVETYWNEYTQIPPVSDNLIPVTPAITNITRLVGGNIQISGTGQDGAAYRVLTSGNVTQPRTNWAEIHSGTFSSGQFQFTDTSATNPSRYYWIVTP